LGPDLHAVGVERPRTPQKVFDRVAPYYDALNSALSFGLDRRWRRRTIDALRLAPGARVLDVATGTGALALEIARRTGGDASITGCDVNERMLSVATRRLERAGARVELVQCDATKLPFANESFDAVTIGFAIDDMPDREACAREAWRVLRPGGQLALLELAQPDSPLFRALFRAYLRVFRIFRHFAVDGYDHLEQEILKYRGAAAVEGLLAGSGFGSYRRESMAFGAARFHVAKKPPKGLPGAS
jgi:demethylmenaquinone methyltransferase/2-methoxy-6-polyprenyl-1,4-benzoquinol methylase